MRDIRTLNIRRLAVIIAIQTYLGLTTQAIVQQDDRLTLDWGQNRIRSYGVYSPASATEKKSLIEQEKHAIQEGISYLHRKIRDLHQRRLIQDGVPIERAQESARRASELVSRTTATSRTEVFAHGAIRVHLENSLPRALARHDQPLHPRKTTGKSRFSGLVFNVAKDIKPQAEIRLVDSTGNVLFSFAQMDKEAYESNLMGRWFSQENAEFRAWVGKKSLAINLGRRKNGDFVLRHSKWLEISRDAKPLLERGKVALLYTDTAPQKNTDRPKDGSG